MLIWQAHERSIVSLAFSPDGVLATAGHQEPGVRLWDVGSTVAHHELALFRENATCLQFSPDGRVLAVGRPWSVELWDPTTGDRQLILEGHRHFSASLAFDAEGTTLLSGGGRLGGRWLGSTQAIVWSLADGRVTAEFVGPPDQLLGLTRAIDAETILWSRPIRSGKSDHIVTMTNVVSAKSQAVFNATAHVRDGASPKVGKIVAAAIRGDVVLWPLDDPTEPTIQRPSGWRRWLWQTPRPLPPSRKRQLTLPSGAERIDALAFTPDGRTIMAGSAVGHIRVWDVPDFPQHDEESPPAPTPRAQFDWGIGPVTALGVSSDGLLAAAGGASGLVVVWDLEGS